MTINYRLLLATVQEVTERMFTTTLSSQPIYSRSRLSEFAPARESGRFNETDSDNARDRDATFGRWFHCLTGPLTYVYECSHLHLSFSMHMPNGKSESNVTPGPDRVSKEAKRGSHKPYMWSYFCLGSQNRNTGPRQCSTREPTVYSYTASHRSPLFRVDSPTRLQKHHCDHPSRLTNINILIVTLSSIKQ